MGIKKAFTLIEIIIVISIISIIIPIIYTIIFNLAQQQLKVFRLTTVKNEGDYIINTLNYLIKNDVVSIHSASPANELNQVCKTNSYQPPPTTGLVFYTRYNNEFRIYLNNNKIASSSSIITYLNSNSTFISNFNISCQQSNEVFSTPLVLINFTICYKNPSGQCSSNRFEEINNLNYQTAIKLRNY